MEELEDALEQTVSTYDRISYDAWNSSDYEEGLAKLFAKGFVRYGFDCYDAISIIETDSQTALDRFQADFNAQMQDEILAGIVEPVLRLCAKLEVAL